MRRLAILVSLFCGITHGAEQPMRSWQHVGGVFGIDASFVELKGDTLVLRRPRGELVSVPLTEFSQADRDFASKLAANRVSDTRVSLGAELVNTVDVIESGRNSPRLKLFADPPVKIGAMIARVYPNGAADAAQLQVGDIVYRIERQPVKDAAEIRDKIATFNVNDEVLIRIVRPFVRGGHTTWREVDGRVTLLPEPDVTDSPLDLVAIVGSDVLDDPKLIVAVRNVGQQAVIAYEFRVSSFNRFDEPVRGSLTGNEGERLLGQQTIAVGETTRVTYTFHWRETTAKVKIILTRVKMADGSVWQPPEGREVSTWAESPK